MSTRRITRYWLISLLLMFCACGSPNTNTQNTTATGAYQARLVFPPNITHSEMSVQNLIGIDCSQIETIAFTFSRNDVTLISRNFLCSDGKAVIDKIPSGDEIRVEAYAYLPTGKPLFYGVEVTTIRAGEVTQGTIKMVEYVDDFDQDGDGYTGIEDCDESDPDIHIDAQEIPGNEVDDNCDGIDIGPSGDSFTIVELDMEFMRIPAGSSFEMGGSPEDSEEFENETPRHWVTFTQDYYIQTTEVTQKQYVTIMRVNPSYFSTCGENCPVESVSWRNVRAFIDDLNRRFTAVNALFDGEYEFALPTEAQWENAARAGRDTLYGFGDTLAEDQANFNNTYNRPTEVKRFAPNEWGLYDMHGNVWEWVEDDYHDNYEDAPVDGSAWIYEPRGVYRIMRGGSWDYDAQYCRSAYRHWAGPDAHYNDDGFRVAFSQGGR